jgi:hypothetical protein
VEPANELEHALIAAGTDASVRPTFYRLLLESPLYAIDTTLDATGSSHEEGIRIAGPNETLPLQALELDGKPHVAVFSSLPRLKHVLTGARHYVSMDGRALLQAVRGSHVVLNPGSEYGKVLVPEEIEAVLAGPPLGAQPHHVSAGTRIRLGHPARFPHPLVDALQPVLRKTKSVRAAYLALIHEPESSVPPHIVIGVDHDGDWNSFLQTATAVARDVECANPPIDFIEIDGGPVAGYLVAQTKPFYKRNLFGFS